MTPSQGCLSLVLGRLQFSSSHSKTIKSEDYDVRGPRNGLIVISCDGVCWFYCLSSARDPYIRTHLFLLELWSLFK